MDRQNRLRHTAGFARVRQEGRTVSSRLLGLGALRLRDDPDVPVRCGFVVSRRVGKAVIRNRVRRRLRAIMHPIVPELEHGWVLAFSARPAAATASYQELVGAVTDLLRRARVARQMVSVPDASGVPAGMLVRPDSPPAPGAPEPVGQVPA